jgi:hypothetical protein
MYHAIGKKIKITDGAIPIMGISIIGTSEYRRNDWIPMYFRIALRLNDFSDKSFILKNKTPNVATAKTAIRIGCHDS